MFWRYKVSSPDGGFIIESARSYARLLTGYNDVLGLDKDAAYKGIPESIDRSLSLM